MSESILDQRLVGILMEMKVNENTGDGELVRDGRQSYLGDCRVPSTVVDKLLRLMAIRDVSDSKGLERYVINSVGKAIINDPGIVGELVRFIAAGRPFTVREGKLELMDQSKTDNDLHQGDDTDNRQGIYFGRDRAHNAMVVYKNAPLRDRVIVRYNAHTAMLSALKGSRDWLQEAIPYIPVGLHRGNAQRQLGRIVEAIAGAEQKTRVTVTASDAPPHLKQGDTWARDNGDGTYTALKFIDGRWVEE